MKSNSPLVEDRPGPYTALIKLAGHFEANCPTAKRAPRLCSAIPLIVHRCNQSAHPYSRRESPITPRSAYLVEDFASITVWNRPALSRLVLAPVVEGKTQFKTSLTMILGHSELCAATSQLKHYRLRFGVRRGADPEPPLGGVDHHGGQSLEHPSKRGVR
jgi:hypothetical protein